MNIAIHIPAWLLWTVSLVIGVPLALAILFCAWIGFQFMREWGNGGYV